MTPTKQPPGLSARFIPIRYQYDRFDRSDRQPTALEILSELISPFAMARVLFSSTRHYDRLAMLQHRTGTDLSSILSILEKSKISDSVRSFSIHASTLMFDNQKNWRTQWKPWQDFVDAGFEAAPAAETFIRAALLSTAVNPRFDVDDEVSSFVDEGATNVKHETPEPKDYTDQGDHAVWSTEGFTPNSGLVERLQVAQSHSDNAGWWEQQLEDVNEKGIAGLICLAMFCLWAKPAVVSELRCTLDAAIDSLSKKDWSRLVDWVQATSAVSDRFSTPLSMDWFCQRKTSSPRSDCLLSLRIEGSKAEPEAYRLVGRHLYKSITHNDRRILRRAAELELMGGQSYEIDWPYITALSRTARTLDMASFAMVPLGIRLPIPPAVAKETLSESPKHCAQWVALCEHAYQSELSQNVEKVSHVAKRDNWFTDD